MNRRRYISMREYNVGLHCSVSLLMSINELSIDTLLLLLLLLPLVMVMSDVFIAKDWISENHAHLMVYINYTSYSYTVLTEVLRRLGIDTGSVCSHKKTINFCFLA